MTKRSRDYRVGERKHRSFLRCFEAIIKAPGPQVSDLLEFAMIDPISVPGGREIAKMLASLKDYDYRCDYKERVAMGV